jgi:mRNA-degrading endonuclease HigB of HigAB toxin-antitoxin module
MNRIRNFRYIPSIVCILLLAGGTYAQQEEQEIPTTDPNQTAKTRTELLNELSLREALVRLENAREAHDRFESEYRDAERLIKQNIIAQKDLDDAWSRYSQAQQALKQAEIQLDQTKLSFLANATHITIMEAKKYYDSEGRRMLDLVLKNSSNLTQAESALSLTETKSESGLRSEWQSPEQIQALLDIENIIVSIVSNNASIGKPYEKIIPMLRYGAQEKLKFMLLTDVQEAGVKLKYLNQDVIEYVYLEKESLQEIPTVVAAQYSQEGQLGTDINYRLDLEMLVTSDTSFSLLVTNLPPQINFSFVDSSSGARITSVRFTELVSKHDLALRVSIPQKLDVSMIDKTIDFEVWVVTAKQAEILNTLRQEYAGGTIPTEKFDQIKAGRVGLVLIPRGTGRLEILINNLFEEIKPQQDVDIKADLHNDGTLTLFNIVPEISPPLGWKAEVLPKLVEKLSPNDKQSLQIHLSPGQDVGVGEYEARIEARGQSGSEVVEALEKRFKVRISAKTNITATVALVAGLIVLITGILFVGVKLSRR